MEAFYLMPSHLGTGMFGIHVVFLTSDLTVHNIMVTTIRGEMFFSKPLNRRDHKVLGCRHKRRQTLFVCAFPAVFTPITPCPPVN